MMVVTWNDERHSLKIPQMDIQHQELFMITNYLYEHDGMPQSSERKLKILAGLKRLYAYCHFHFNSEEELLRDHGYPQSPEHKILHRDFTEQVKGYLETAREAAHPDISKVLDTLVAWILEHIQVEDKKYADYFLHNNIKLTEETAREDSALKLWHEKHMALEIKGIDDQHKELIRILQQANDLLRASVSRQRLFLPSIIRKLFYYSQYHFSFEEELMSRHNFSNLAEHKQQHNYFIKRIIHFTEEYKQGVSTLSEEVVEFLREWTIHHILHDDRSFRDSLDPHHLD